jgi:hypothetical protein
MASLSASFSSVIQAWLVRYSSPSLLGSSSGADWIYTVAVDLVNCANSSGTYTSLIASAPSWYQVILAYYCGTCSDNPVSLPSVQELLFNLLFPGILYYPLNADINGVINQEYVPTVYSFLNWTVPTINLSPVQPSGNPLPGIDVGAGVSWGVNPSKFAARLGLFTNPSAVGQGVSRPLIPPAFTQEVSTGEVSFTQVTPVFISVVHLLNQIASNDTSAGGNYDASSLIYLVLSMISHNDRGKCVGFLESYQNYFQPAIYNPVFPSSTYTYVNPFIGSLSYRLPNLVQNGILYIPIFFLPSGASLISRYPHFSESYVDWAPNTWVDQNIAQYVNPLIYQQFLPNISAMVKSLITGTVRWTNNIISFGVGNWINSTDYIFESIVTVPFGLIPIRDSPTLGAGTYYPYIDPSWSGVWLQPNGGTEREYDYKDEDSVVVQDDDFSQGDYSRITRKLKVFRI